MSIGPVRALGRVAAPIRTHLSPQGIQRVTHIGHRQLKKAGVGWRPAVAGPVHHIDVVSLSGKEDGPAFTTVRCRQVCGSVVMPAMDHDDGRLARRVLGSQYVHKNWVLCRTGIAVCPLHVPVWLSFTAVKCSTGPYSPIWYQNTSGVFPWRVPNQLDTIGGDGNDIPILEAMQGRITP
jgi:hypothetical protein